MKFIIQALVFCIILLSVTAAEIDKAEEIRLLNQDSGTVFTNLESNEQFMNFANKTNNYIFFLYDKYCLYAIITFFFFLSFPLLILLSPPFPFFPLVFLSLIRYLFNYFCHWNPFSFFFSFRHLLARLIKNYYWYYCSNIK